jgi:protease I
MIMKICRRRMMDMARIAVLIGDMFEDVEYTEPVKAFRKAGHEIVHVGLKKNSTVKGKKEGTPVKIGLAVKDASVGEFDALLIPGGYSPDKLRVDEDAVSFAREFVKSSKPVFSICHGPQLLITADVLRGRKVTGWKSIIQDIKNAGAEFIDQEVVEDGNLISSRQPNDIPAFVGACLKKLP